VTTVDLPGAAHLMLVDGVSYLDPASAVLEAMLEGWARQQRTRGLATDKATPPPDANPRSGSRLVASS
jgi:hypothetical protein